MRRPNITDFMGDGFTLDKAHKQYLENLELWNYIQAQDKYIDYFEAFAVNLAREKQLLEWKLEGKIK